MQVMYTHRRSKRAQEGKGGKNRGVCVFLRIDHVQSVVL